MTNSQFYSFPCLLWNATWQEILCTKYVHTGYILLKIFKYALDLIFFVGFNTYPTQTRSFWDGLKHMEQKKNPNEARKYEWNRGGDFNLVNATNGHWQGTEVPVNTVPQLNTSICRAVLLVLASTLQPVWLRYPYQVDQALVSIAFQVDELEAHNTPTMERYSTWGGGKCLPRGVSEHRANFTWLYSWTRVGLHLWKKQTT